MQLRPYQQQLKRDVQDAWAAGARNVLMRLDTGGGKTAILSNMVSEHPGASAVIAHRSVLVSQLSLTLAAHGVAHNLIASRDTARAISALHLRELGQSFYNPGARCAVASIDTLIRAKDIDHWAAQVTFWITDEGHHVVEDNKWHRGIQKFTNPTVRGLLPTATPDRADRKGLGRPSIGGHGVADVMVQGPPMRWLIEQGFLTDYRVVCPTSDLEILEDAPASGDWSTAQLRDAAERSHIVGDVVAQYLRFGRGKLGITFSTDVETAKKMQAAYRAAGVRAELITGETDEGYRRQILRRYAARELDQIVAVDIVSEGFDLPAIEVASMARPTKSLALFMQQFGRALRPMAGKDRALIIDHVGNFVRHGPPDRPREWLLVGKRGSGGGGGIPFRVCVNAECAEPYERYHVECPHCGEIPPPPAIRSAPNMVDGDLAELDAETLNRLRGAVVAADRSPEDYQRWLVETGCPSIGIKRNVSVHALRQEAQGRLRQAMTAWVVRQLGRGLRDREIHRKFFLVFGCDVLSARALGVDEAETLTAKVQAND